MKFRNLNELFALELQKAYAAEHLAGALPRLASKGGPGSPADRHPTNIRERMRRIERLFGSIGRPPEIAACPVVEDILREADQLVHATDDPSARGAALGAAMNAMRHDRIARYETLASWAAALNMPDAASVLKGMLEEDRSATASPSQPGDAGSGLAGMGDRLTALFDRKK